MKLFNHNYLKHIPAIYAFDLIPLNLLHQSFKSSDTDLKYSVDPYNDNADLILNITNG